MWYMLGMIWVTRFVKCSHGTRDLLITFVMHCTSARHFPVDHGFGSEERRPSALPSPYVCTT